VGLPDFLIIGAPKAGTTALHVALGGHPQLFLSSVKEPKYFLTDGPPQTRGGPGADHSKASYIWRRDEYEELFAEAPPGTLCGESTTLYLSDMAAHRRMHALVPRARLIAVLRDPVDRAHSGWTHSRSVGLERERDFRVACSLEEERQRAGWGPLWSYLRLGRYGEQVEHLYRYFPPRQVLLLRYRDLRNEPERTIARVCNFLGVDPYAVRSLPALNVTADVSVSPVNELLRRVMRSGSSLAYKLPGRVPETIGRLVGTPTLRLLQRHQRTRQPLTVEERKALIPEFASDIALLERVTGASFQDWLDPGNSLSRPPLGGAVRVGATFNTIDRPLEEAPALRRRGERLSTADVR
jgi:Sulfotransferase family